MGSGGEPQVEQAGRGGLRILPHGLLLGDLKIPTGWLTGHRLVLDGGQRLRGREVVDWDKEPTFTAL